MIDRMTIEAKDGTFEAHVALPHRPNGAVVVVLHEIFGVNSDMRQTGSELASLGYTAVCPDLFWRTERGVDLSDGSEHDWKRGLQLYNAFDRDAGVRDVELTLRSARSLTGRGGGIGVMGYCLGGLLTYLLAARSSCDAAVAYYGGGTEGYLDEARSIRSPLLMHLAEEDEYIGPDARRKIVETMKAVAGVSVFTYPACSHAFARHGGQHFVDSAARIANSRTWDFFAKHLVERTPEAQAPKTFA